MKEFDLHLAFGAFQCGIGVHLITEPRHQRHRWNARRSLCSFCTSRSAQVLHRCTGSPQKDRKIGKEMGRQIVACILLVPNGNSPFFPRERSDT